VLVIFAGPQAEAAAVTVYNSVVGDHTGMVSESVRAEITANQNVASSPYSIISFRLFHPRSLGLPSSFKLTQVPDSDTGVVLYDSRHFPEISFDLNQILSGRTDAVAKIKRLHGQCNWERSVR